MKPLNDNGTAFVTQIQFPGVEIKLDEVDVNILDVDPQALHQPLSKRGDNWEWSVSISTDKGDDYDEEYDQLVCYLNAKLILEGEKYPCVRLNTLHTYHISKLKYKKAHEELYKSIACESVAHANILLQRSAKGTPYEEIRLPEFYKNWLDEDASEWNKRGYIPRPSQPNKDAFGRKPSKEELDAMTKRMEELVAFIDAYDESESPHTEEETLEYWKRYGEWAKLNKQIWHFKLIGRNLLAYLSNKMVVAMEKAVKANPDDYLLKESYEEIKTSYLAIMEEWKDEFAKN